MSQHGNPARVHRFTSLPFTSNDADDPWTTTASPSTMANARSAMRVVGVILPTSSNASAVLPAATIAALEGANAEWPCRYEGGLLAAATARPPPNIDSLNASDAAEMLECLARGSAFYDACQRKCYTDMSILHMTQGLQLEHIVYGQLFPILVLLVVLANVFVVLVLSQKHMITPTNVVLKYMAIADLCVGLVPLPWNFFYHTLGNSEHDERIQLWWCYMYKYSMDAIPPVCHNIAMWLTVLLTGQRFISIQYPILSRRLCTVRNVRFATIAITCTSVLCGLPKSVDYYFEVYEGWAFMEPGEWVYLKSCLSGFTVFVKVFGSNTFFNVYFWTRVFGFILLPSVLLIILNTLLIRSIRQAKHRKDRLLKEKRAREAQRQKDSNSTSIMLVVIVTIFLVVNLPQAVFMAMLCVQNTFGVSNSILEGDFPAAFLLVSNMLVMATYPINFGIYCFMSSSFRDTFRMFFCRKNWPRSLISRRGTMSCGGGYNRYTVRRSDPSLQFSDINCSGCNRYSISDTMVVGNGIRASSATVTVMPFLPLLGVNGTVDNKIKTESHSSPTRHSVAAAVSSADTTTTTTTATTPSACDYYVSGGSAVDSQHELGMASSLSIHDAYPIQRELSSAKTLESTISNNSTDTMRSLAYADDYVASNLSPENLCNGGPAGNRASTNAINAWELNTPSTTTASDDTQQTITQSIPPPSYDESTRSEPAHRVNYWPPPDYAGGNDIFMVGEKIADIADTDEKIREADAVYL